MAVAFAPSIQIPEAFRGFLVSETLLTEAPTLQLELSSVIVSPGAGTASPDLLGLMGVAAAASRLGVHENTIRNWTNQGVLKAVRLPGGHRRLRISDVERVRSEIFGSNAGMASEDEDSPSQGRIDGRLTQGKPEEGW
jgi:excisionase family DNA binding protein